MTEASLTSNLLSVLRKELSGAVVLKHADAITSGIPDFSVTYLGKTSWWECKFANPGFKSHGIQELTALRLAAAGYCRYIVWELKRNVKRMLIVHPRDLKGLQPEAFCIGYDMRWLVEQVRKAHGA